MKFLTLLTVLIATPSFADTVSEVMGVVLSVVPVGTTQGKVGSDCLVVVTDHRPAVNEAEVSILKASTSETLVTLVLREQSSTTKIATAAFGSGKIKLNQNETGVQVLKYTAKKKKRSLEITSDGKMAECSLL